MNELALAMGLVLAVEGLVLALAPRRLEDALRLLVRLRLDQRRGLGMMALAVGVGLIWLVRH